MKIVQTLIRHKFKAVALLVFLLVLIIALVMTLFNAFFASNYQVSRYAIESGAVYSESLDSSVVSRPASLGFNSKQADYIIEPPYEQGEELYDESQERQIIKSGSLSMVVQNIENARSSIQYDVQQAGGFISGANFWENQYTDYSSKKTKNRTSGSIQIRVPSENFTELVTEIKKHALSVTNENISTDDVTERYADLETQIANKTAEENQYRAILQKATKISDILEITQYLNKTRGEIERMQGQLNRLSNQVEMSSVNVQLTAEEDLELFGVVWSPIEQVKDSLRSLIAGLVQFINQVIGLVFILPIIALYVGLYGALFVGILYMIYKMGKKVVKKIKSGNQQ